MSTDATAPAGPYGSRETMQRLLIEALANGARGRASLREILEHAPMAADQKSMVEFLLSLDEQGKAAPPSPEPSGPGEEASAADGERIRGLKQELADLREVNDTVAAALGACRVCWGGDAACPGCAGRGRAGSTLPDPALFKELVVPAVRRVRSLEPRVARPASRRSRLGDSREWRHSHEW